MQQISVFIENASGTLSKVLGILGRENIQLFAISIADTSKYGICRIICSDTDRAFNALSSEGVAVSVSDVVVVVMNDRPGAASDILCCLSANGVSVSYLYSFALDSTSLLAFKTEDNARAREILRINSIEEKC